MARGFRGSRFRGGSGAGGGMGEDVNPQAYIVNLADCMLVLACGFMVMLVARYNLNISNDVEVTEDQLSQIETDQSDQSFENGSAFVEAGTAYYDPATGTYYIKEATDEEGNTVTSASSGSSSSGSSSSTSGSGSSSSSSGSSSASDKAIRDAKAAGAD